MERALAPPGIHSTPPPISDWVAGWEWALGPEFVQSDVIPKSLIGPVSPPSTYISYIFQNSCPECHKVHLLTSLGVTARVRAQDGDPVRHSMARALGGSGCIANQKGG
eukprot:g5443.t1